MKRNIFILPYEFCVLPLCSHTTHTRTHTLSLYKSTVNILWHKVKIVTHTKIERRRESEGREEGAKWSSCLEICRKYVRNMQMSHSHTHVCLGKCCWEENAKGLSGICRMLRSRIIWMQINGQLNCRTALMFLFLPVQSRPNGNLAHCLTVWQSVWHICGVNLLWNLATQLL